MAMLGRIRAPGLLATLILALPWLQQPASAARVQLEDGGLEGAGAGEEDVGALEHVANASFEAAAERGAAALELRANASSGALALAASGAGANASTALGLCRKPRCCQGTWKGEDGYARGICDVFEPRHLNWQCRCPKILIRVEGATFDLNTHYCGEGIPDCNAWRAADTPERVYTGDTFRACQSRMPQLVTGIQVGNIFGVGSITDWASYVPYRSLFNEQADWLNDESEEAALPTEHGTEDLKVLLFLDVLGKADYEQERQRLQALKLIKVKKSIVVESKVRSVCDLSLASLWRLQRSQMLRAGLSAWCGLKDAASYPDWLLRDSLVKECFGGCLTAISNQTWLPSRVGRALKCEFMEAPEVSKNFFEEEPECNGLPPDTQLGLMEWVLQQRCWDFYPPSPVWGVDDKGNEGPASGKNHEVCMKVDQWKTVALRGPSHGTCPEGTACACPTQEFITTKSVNQIRRRQKTKDGQHLVVGHGIEGGKMLLKHDVPVVGYAIVGAQVAKAVADKDWAMIAAIGMSMGVGIVLTSTLGLHVLVAAVPAYFAKHTTYAVLKDCARTIGCWPQKATVKDGFCEMSNNAFKGGSPAWFMPPAGLKLRPNRGMFKFCQLETCSPDELAGQVVGYRGQSLLNCQPLHWQDMDLKQRLVFATLLANTCVDENSCGDVRMRRAKQLLKVAQQRPGDEE